MSSVTTTRRPAPVGEGCRSPVPGAFNLTRFKSDERGNVAMSFGLMIFMMMGFIGASVDIGRWMLARKQTQEAIDSAVLAGMRSYQSGSTNINPDVVANAEAAALVSYRYAIEKSGRGFPETNPMIVSDNVSFKLSPDHTSMSVPVDKKAVIKTPFIGIATNAFSNGTKISTLPLLHTLGLENAVAKVAMGGNAGTNLEISVMIDITGSMNEGDNSGSTKIQTVKTAAKNMVDILVWTDQSTYTSKIAIVPFSEAVNLGNPSVATKARGTFMAGAASNKGGSQYLTVNGTNLPISNICVTERIGYDEYTDADPNSSPVGRYYSTYGTSQGTGKCPTATPILPLTSDKTALKATITALSAGGTTAGHIGTAWAWYMLSPNFNAIWNGSANTARPYSDLTALTAKGRPVLRKIAVLMTDGDYNTEYCNGVTDWYRSCTPNNGSAVSQALALCAGMKAKGIEVFTIGAQVSNNAKTMLKACATDPAHFYDATDGTKMQQAFTDIAYKLVPPYISH